jgi:hypothetical protein
MALPSKCVQILAPFHHLNSIFPLFRCFVKPKLTYGKRRTGRFPPIINEWGRAWVVPGQLRAVLRQSMVNQRGNIFL